MRKTLALIIALATTVSVFAGCGTSSKSSTDKTGSAKNITITMMVSGTKASSGEDFVLDTLPKKVHEAYPNITLETTKMPDDQYNTAIATKLASGEAPDIFLVFPKSETSGVNDFAKAGYLMDLSGMSFWDNIAKGAKDDMSYNGKPYAVSQGMDLLGTYYNKDLFKKAGIPSEPQNWDEFLADCAKLKAAGIQPIVMGDKDSYVMQFGLYQIAANTIYPDDPNLDKNIQDGTGSFSKSNWSKAVSMYQQLYSKGYIVNNSLGLSSAQAIQNFIDGKAAMIFDGDWDYNAITAKGASEFERGYMPLPANSAGKTMYVSASTAAGYAVNAKTKYPNEVKKIFELMNDGKSDLFQAWKGQLTSVPVYKGLPLNHDLFKEVYDIYQKGNSYYFCNAMWPGGVAEEMESKFGEIIGKQKTTPDDVVKAMDAKFKEVWKN